MSTTKDPEGFPHSGASSSSKQTAASRVLPMLGSSGAIFWKQWRDHETVDSRTGIQKTGPNLDGICCSNSFQFTVRREERSRSKRCAFVKLRLKLRQEIGKRGTLTGDQSGIRVPTITTTGESMGRSGSKRQNKLVWRIGNEESALPRRSCKRLPRN